MAGKYKIGGVCVRCELESKLSDEFVFMRSTDPHGYQKLGSPMYCECGDGWYDIIWNLCYELKEHYVQSNVNPSGIVVQQIKEKFGQLRFYVGWMIDGSHEIIEKYEKLSESTCEVCGDKGELRTDKWVQVLCDNHYKKDSK